MNNSSSDYLNVVVYRFATAQNIKPYPRFDLSSRRCYHRFWPLTSSSESKSVESSSIQWKSFSYFTISCRTMISLTKLIAHSSATTERFSTEAVSVMLNWSAGKCTLVIAEETGEGLKIVRAVNLRCDTVRLTLPTLPICWKVRVSAFLAPQDLEWGYLDNTKHSIF